MRSDVLFHVGIVLQPASDDLEGHFGLELGEFEFLLGELLVPDFDLVVPFHAAELDLLLLLLLLFSLQRFGLTLRALA
ncbi:MAG: hypothetical protein LC689_12040, partial [Myxococcales bacterium]|nr:hypothetical protein [Myxococcales bacterium]